MRRLTRAHLNERVDGHDGHIGLRLGVVHQVQIDQLLQLEIVRLHAVDDVREERGNVLANRHAGDDLEIGKKKTSSTLLRIREKKEMCHPVASQPTYLLDRFLFLLLLVIVELGFELEDFTLFGGGKVFGVGHPW